MSTDIHHHHDHAQGAASRAILGFWVFLMTDCITFAGLFATFAVLNSGVDATAFLKFKADLFGFSSTIHIGLVQTIILLFTAFFARSSVTAVRNGRLSSTRMFIVLSFIGTLAFSIVGWGLLSSLYHHKISWHESAYWSVIFTMLAIHLAHLFFAMVWQLILLIQFTYKKATITMKTRVTCLSMFTGFLSLVWIAIFAIVFLMGGVAHV